jgi:hypothetical protein
LWAPPAWFARRVSHPINACGINVGHNKGQSM